MKILFRSIDEKREVKSEQFVDIEGLQFALPKRSPHHTQALVILNVPNTYAIGQDYPGIEFSINADEKTVHTGCYTYEMKKPESYARKPITLVTLIELKDKEIKVEPQWRSLRGCKGIIEFYADVSALLGT